MSAEETPTLKFTTLPPVTGDAEAAAILASIRHAPAGVERAGDVVGCFTLREKIGDGGFGSVWRAEQQEPVRREVALKIIKAGMDTLEVMARFEQERATLALMDHPNISKVLDAGSTVEGRPFFAMELVRGVPVTDYVVLKALPLEERLRLFKDICAGVQHAHQKGIIHRDLKPSNILVTEIDGEPVPKIIDFGIAKALTGGLLGGLTLHTRAEQMIGTPIYMSPEQACGSVDVDTRSDVYALGVLLYELLAGQPPFDARMLLAGGYDEMRRIIREVEPVAPSRRKAGDTSIVNTAARTAHGPAFGRRPLKDLDLITLRALRKERARRYASATALADDIQRFLDHEPVTARAPSPGYLLQRWVRRHRAVAACLLTLVLGSSVAVWQAVRATRSEQRARASERQALISAQKAAASNQEALASAKDADAASHLILKTLRDFDPGVSGRAFQKDDFQRELLLRVRTYPGSPMRKADMLMEIAVSMSGDDKVATEQAGVDLAATVLPPDDAHLWRMRHSLAVTKATIDPYRERGLAELRVLFTEVCARAGADHRSSVRCGFDLGQALFRLGRPEEAVPLLAKAERAARDTPQHFSPSELMSFRMGQAELLKSLGRIEEALALGRENVRFAQTERGPRHRATGAALLTHARLCGTARLHDEAASMARKAMDVFLVCMGPLDESYLQALDFTLAMLTVKKDTEGALALHQEVTTMYDQKVGAAHPSTAARQAAWISALAQTGRKEEAQQKADAWLARLHKPGQPLPAVCEKPLHLRNRLLIEAKQWARAEAGMRDLQLLLKAHRPADAQRWEDLDALGYVLFRQNKHAEAAATMEKVLATLEKAPESDRRTHHLPLVRQQLERVRAAMKQSQPPQA